MAKLYQTVQKQNLWYTIAMRPSKLNPGDTFGKWTIISREGKSCIALCGGCDNEYKRFVSNILARNSLQCLACNAKEVGYAKTNGYDLQWQMATVYRLIKGSADKRGKQWELTPAYVFDRAMSDCAYCGRPPSNQYKAKGFTLLYNGLDRFDNNKGYVEWDTLPCCWPCNDIKGNLSHDEFLLRVHLIANNNPINMQQWLKYPDDTYMGNLRQSVG